MVRDWWPGRFPPYLNSLQAGLKSAGWEEGRNLRILRFASAKYPDDFAAVVPQVMAAKPEVVVTHEFATVGMRDFSKGAVPVVFGFSGDPIEAKLVKRLARPETSFSCAPTE